jgi:hypothetical protein
MHGSSILQQSINDLQTLQGQHSYYSDPQCKNLFLKKENLKIILLF